MNQTQKNNEREKIAQQTKEYLKRGGKIKKVKHPSMEEIKKDFRGH